MYGKTGRTGSECLPIRTRCYRCSLFHLPYRKDSRGSWRQRPYLTPPRVQLRRPKRKMQNLRRSVSAPELVRSWRSPTRWGERAQLGVARPEYPRCRESTRKLGGKSSCLYECGIKKPCSSLRAERLHRSTGSWGGG